MIRADTTESNLRIKLLMLGQGPINSGPDCKQWAAEEEKTKSKKHYLLYLIRYRSAPLSSSTKDRPLNSLFNRLSPPLLPRTATKMPKPSSSPEDIEQLPLP